MPKRLARKCYFLFPNITRYTPWSQMRNNGSRWIENCRSLPGTGCWDYLHVNLLILPLPSFWFQHPNLERKKKACCHHLWLHCQKPKNSGWTAEKLSGLRAWGWEFEFTTVAPRMEPDLTIQLCSCLMIFISCKSSRGLAIHLCRPLWPSLLKIF